jgi:drug/metabolite transporter (DMT)-like permease
VYSSLRRVPGARSSRTRAVSNWLLFFVPSLIWGTTWLTIKFQLGVVAPEVSVVYRFALASALLFAWCAARKIPLRFEARTHAALMLLGFLQYGLNYVFTYLSEQTLTSGLVAVVFALMVVWNLVGARIFFGSRLTAPVAVGAACGLLGVTLVFWPEVSTVSGSHEQIGGMALAVVATLSASCGNLWSQRVYARAIGVAPSTAFAMMYSAIGLAIICAIRGIPFTFEATAGYLISLAYLAIFGSVVAFATFLTLLKRIGAGRAGYTSVVIPVLAMLLSTLFEGYRWTLLALLGLALVVAGNVMVLRDKQKRA